MRKHTRSCLLLFFLLVSISLLPGCGGASVPTESNTTAPAAQTGTPAPAAPPGEFTLPWIPGEGLDPYSGESRVNSVLFPLLYEPLFALTPAWEAEPCLCASYASQDAMEYTFSLHSDAAFSDGSPLTAADVLYSLNKAMGPDSRYSARLSDVRAISAPDEGTVVVTLQSPNAGFPALLDIPVVKKDSSESGTPVGTGPFLLTPGPDADSLSARYDWWQNKVFPLDTIRLYEIKSTGELLSAFQTRTLSLLTADLSGANTPGYRGDYEVRDCPSPVMLYLGLNTAESGSLLSDPVLRRALMRGVDRTLIASSLYAEHAQAAALPLSPAAEEYPDALAESLGFSREALRNLLSAAGWTDLNGDGFLEKPSGRQTIPLQLRLLVCADSSYKTAAAKVIADTLSDAGVAVTVETYFWDQYSEALGNGEFDLYLGEVRLTADFDLRPLLFADGALNYGAFSNPELETLLRDARRTGDESAQSLFFSRFAEQAPMIPILFKNETILTQRDLVTGIVPTCQNAFYNLQDWNLHLD